MPKVVGSFFAIVILAVPFWGGLFVGSAIKEAHYQKIAVADGCGKFNSVTLDFERYRVLEGVSLEKVLTEEISTTKALKGGKK